ncbi:MAG: tetratricopeptide repeat protein, partial [Cyanobacteria bacterium]|nr:tetratricopeptide repeat protein [Cyanobacteriota bacterium]
RGTKFDLFSDEPAAKADDDDDGPMSGGLRALLMGMASETEVSKPEPVSTVLDPLEDEIFAAPDHKPGENQLEIEEPPVVVEEEIKPEEPSREEEPVAAVVAEVVAPAKQTLGQRLASALFDDDNGQSIGPLTAALTMDDDIPSEPPAEPPIQKHRIEIAPEEEEPPAQQHRIEVAPEEEPPPAQQHRIEVAPEEEPPPAQQHRIEVAPEEEPPPAQQHRIEGAPDSEPPPPQQHRIEVAPEEPPVQKHRIEIAPDRTSGQKAPAHGIVSSATGRGNRFSQTILPEQAKASLLAALVDKDTMHAESFDSDDTPDNAGTAFARLAEKYFEQGNYAEAQTVYERMLVHHLNSYGPNSPELVDDYNNLAMTLCVQNMFDKALPFMKRAVSLYELKKPAPDPIGLADYLHSLSTIEFKLKNYDAAQEAILKVLNLRKDNLPRDHEDLGRALADYAKILKRLGKDEVAEKVYKTARQILNK